MLAVVSVDKRDHLVDNDGPAERYDAQAPSNDGFAARLHRVFAVLDSIDSTIETNLGDQRDKSNLFSAKQSVVAKLEPENNSVVDYFSVVKVWLDETNSLEIQPDSP